MSFRDNLLYLRDSRNMTQEHLAMLLGVTRQAVSKWESGASTPDMDKLVRLCEIFEVDLDEMIRGDVTAVPINRALAVPTDAPVSDVTGYDPHMRSRAFFIAGAAAFLVFGAGSVVLLMRDGVDLFLYGGGWGPVLNPYPFYFLLTAAAGALACLAVAHIRHVAFCRAHPFVSNFYTDDDHERARRLSGFSRIASCALVMLGAAIAVIQSTSLQHVSGGLSALVVCCSAAALVAMYGSLMARCIDVEAYNQRAEFLHGGRDVRVRFALIVAAVTIAAAIGSLLFVLSAWSQILIWGAISGAIGWVFFTVFREA